MAVGPTLTYGTVALAILPMGAVGIPWNLWTALLALLIVVGVVAGLQAVLKRRREPTPEGQPMTAGPALVVAIGVILGATLITFAAIRGMPHWQSIPSTWDSVWHANTIRFILDTGQASPTHMGELRNVETHDALYYPSTFHALAAIQSQLTGAAATTAYTLNSLAVAVWLFPASAAALTWHLLNGRAVGQWRAAGSAAAAAALSASFTAVPYVEFDTASMPNLAAYGLAVPTMLLIVSSLRHRDRIPLAVLALLGVFSVHITGGVVTVVFVVAWWLCEGLWRPVRGRLADFVSLVAVAGPTVLLLLPQFVGVLQQAEIIVGHAFVTHEGKKKALFDAVVQHTRHLNVYPIQNALIALAAIGFVILLFLRMWWPVAVWLLLVLAIIHSSAPFGGPLGAVTGRFSDLFYSDPRRLSAVVTMLLAPMAGIALFTVTTAALAGLRRLTPRLGPRVGYAMTAVVLVAVSVGMAWHYFPRHERLIGEKYDRVMIDDSDLEAFAYLATLPGARDTLIGNANTDGTAWVYAVAGLHPLWTHYDYPQQQGPGYHRFIFWAYADDADTDPRVAEAVRALNIRYVITSSPVVRGFVMPDGLVSLGKSKSWKEIYDNGEDHIYEWQGNRT
ncbi:MAG: D-galactosaminyltransferase [Mycobacterium sp.]|nr:D-galactosaminyltransferase [Mycobacterium sp.]